MLTEKEILKKINKILVVFHCCVEKQDATELRDILDNYTLPQLDELILFIQKQMKW